MLKQIILLSLVAVAIAKQNYEGYSVLRTENLNPVQAAALQKALKNSPYDQWKEPTPGRFADVMSGPEHRQDLVALFQRLGIQHEVSIENVQALIDEENLKAAAKRGDSRYSIDWQSYNSIAEINTFLNEIAALDDAYSVKSIGKTSEGNDIMALELNKAGAGAPNIFVEANIHAREWIANAVGTWLIKEVADRTDYPYVDEINFYFVPMANPDGYDYSRSDDRLWRKNRSPNSGTPNCPGTDLNRNWAFHWGETGTSDLHCSDTYHGLSAMSELESQHISTYWNGVKAGASGTAPQLSLCLHCYGQLFLIPYGYASGAYAPNYDHMKDVADSANAALRAVHGTRFTVENSAELYPAAGASDDWYKSEGSDFTYTLELRGNSFMLPEAQIIPSGEEIWAAFKVILDQVISEAKKQ